MSINLDSRYQSLNARLGIIPPNQKGCTEKGWTNSQRNYDQAADEYTGTDYNFCHVLDADHLIVDVDTNEAHGVDGEASFDKLCDQLGVDLYNECNHVVETASGGLHLLFRVPEGTSIAKSVEGFEGLDFLSKGHNIVAAGSVVNGKEYRFKKCQGTTLTDAPESLLKLCEKQVTPKPSIEFTQRSERSGSPLDALNTSVAGLEYVAGMLQDSGYSLHRVNAHKFTFCRPNKTDFTYKISGTVQLGDCGKVIVTNWSTNDPNNLPTDGSINGAEAVRVLNGLSRETLPRFLNENGFGDSLASLPTVSEILGLTKDVTYNGGGFDALCEAWSWASEAPARHSTTPSMFSDMVTGKITQASSDSEFFPDWVYESPDGEETTVTVSEMALPATGEPAGFSNSVGETLDTLMQRISERKDTPMIYFSDTFDGLEVAPEMATVIGAGPATGKTWLTLAIIDNALKNNEGLNVLIANSEMSHQVIAQRLLKMRCPLSVDLRFASKLTDAELMQLELAADQLKHDMQSVSIVRNDICNVQGLREIESTYKPQLLILDYAQDFADPAKDKRAGVDEVLRQVVRMKAKGWAVIVLTATARQQNVKGNAHDTSTLTMSAFKESSGFEYSADFAYVIKRENYSGTHSSLLMNCVKNRHSSFRDVLVDVDWSTMTFKKGVVFEKPEAAPDVEDIGGEGVAGITGGSGHDFWSNKGGAK